MNAATADPEIDIANGEKAREFLGQSMGLENELIGQSNFPRQPSPRGDIAGGYFFPNRQVLPIRLGKSRPGRLRLRICRQRAGLRKAESGASGEANGSGFAISRIARA